MANEVVTKFGGTAASEVVWADTTDFSVTGVTRTDQIDLTSLADAAARQGAKADLGATPAQVYALEARFEIDIAPASGALIEVYLAWSRSATAGSLNPGGVSGSDAAYTGTAGDSLADSVNQLEGPFVFYCTADAATTVQLQHLGLVSPKAQYVSPVVKNESGQAFEGDAVEMYLALTPVVPEIQ